MNLPFNHADMVTLSCCTIITRFISEAPEVFVSAEQQSVSVGERVSVSCNVSGHPQPELHWINKHNGRTLVRVYGCIILHVYTQCVAFRGITQDEKENTFFCIRSPSIIANVLQLYWWQILCHLCTKGGNNYMLNRCTVRKHQLHSIKLPLYIQNTASQLHVTV